MIRRLPRTLGLALLAVAALGAAAAVSASARTARVWFPRNHLPLAHATRLGSAQPSQQMEIGIGFQDPHAAAEQALVAAQQDPSSPQYHHFLTPAQYDARFGLSQTTFNKALAWLQAGGARVLDTSGARNFVEISATVSQVQRLFQTSIGSYQAHGSRFLANASAPSVPAGLHVLTVMGLNTLIHPTTPLTGATRSDPTGAIDSVLGRPTSPTALKSIPGESGLLGSLGGKLGIGGVLGKTRGRHAHDPGPADPAGPVVGVRHAVRQRRTGAVGGRHGRRRLQHHRQGPGGVRERALAAQGAGHGHRHPQGRRLLRHRRQRRVGAGHAVLERHGARRQAGASVLLPAPDRPRRRGGLRDLGRRSERSQAGQRLVRRVRDDARQRDAREHDPGAVQQQPGSERALRHRRPERAGAGRRPDAASGRPGGPHPVRGNRRHRLVVPGAGPRPRARRR